MFIAGILVAVQVAKILSTHMMYKGIQNRNKKLYIVTCGINTEIDKIKKQEIKLLI